MMKSFFNPSRQSIGKNWIHKIKSNSFKWSVGDGKKIFFWEDGWYGDQTLMEKFPKLYSLSLYKNTIISSFLQYWDNKDLVNLRWSKELREWGRRKSKNFSS